MDYVKTVNSMSFDKAAKEKWYLSLQPASSKQTISVKFDDGKSYKYLGTGMVNVGDPVVIGPGGATSYKMGTVDGIEEGVTIKRSHALQPVFTFTTNPDKKSTKKNIDGIMNMDKEREYAAFLKEHGTNGDKNQVIDFMVSTVLSAISVIAFPENCSDAEVDNAKAFLAKEKHVPSVVFGDEFSAKYFGTGYADAEVLITGHYPGWNDDLEKCSALTPESLEENDINAEWQYDGPSYYLYFDFGSGELEDFFDKNEEFKRFTNELVMRSALAIIIRGGFTNLLEAALSVEMPIKGFYSKIKDFAKEIGSTKCYELLSSIDYENMTFDAIKVENKPLYDEGMDIADNIFHRYKGSASILTIPDGVKIIDKEAFRCLEGIKKVIMPDSVTQIKTEAFAFCYDLEEVQFSNKLSTIGKECFTGCKKLNNVDLSNTKVKTLSKRCFNSCDSLENILLPKTLVTIDEGAFGSTAITKITIPASVTKIHFGMFNGKLSFKDVAFEGEKCIDIAIGALPEGSTVYCKKGSELWKSFESQNAENKKRLETENYFKASIPEIKEL